MIVSWSMPKNGFSQKTPYRNRYELAKTGCSPVWRSWQEETLNLTHCPMLGIEIERDSLGTQYVRKAKLREPISAF